MKNLFFHPIVLIVATVASFLFILSLRKTALKSEVSSQNVALLEEKIAQISEEVEQEKEAIEYASSGLAKEKILRNELLLQKPGEYVLQISGESSLEIGDKENQEKSNLEAWRELVF